MPLANATGRAHNKAVVFRSLSRTQVEITGYFVQRLGGRNREVIHAPGGTGRWLCRASARRCAAVRPAGAATRWTTEAGHPVHPRHDVPLERPPARGPDG